MSCQDVKLEYSDEFSDVFANTNAIRFTHAVVPRYGHTADISKLLDGTEDDQEDYLRGLLASSITIFSFFVVWMIVLLAFKWSGPYSVGVLSGRRPPLPPKPEAENYEDDMEGYQEALDEWNTIYHRVSRSQNVMKWLVIFAALSIIVCSILLSVKGVDSLIQALNDGFATITIVKDLLQKGIDLIDNVLSQVPESKLNIEKILDGINHICPAVRDPLCTDIRIPSTCNYEDVFDGQVLSDFAAYVSTVKSLAYDELVQTRIDFADMFQVAEDLEETAKTFNWAFYCSMAFSLTSAFFCLIFVLGAMFELKPVTRCLQHFIIFPIFVLLVVLSWVFSMVFVIGSIGLADLCVDSPDDRMVILLKRFQDSFSPLVYGFIIFYILGCPLSLLPTGLVTHMTFLRQVVTEVTVFTSSLSTEPNDFQNVCGGTTNNVVVVAQTTMEQLCSFLENLRDFGLFMQCSNWYPLYENTVYSAMCYSGTEGFAWVASTQFVIVFMAMFILTFRIVFYDIEISEPSPRKVAESDKEEEQGDEEDGGNGIDGEDDGNGVGDEDDGRIDDEDDGNGVDDADSKVDDADSKGGGMEKPRDD